MFSNATSDTVCGDPQIIKKICELPQNSRHQKCDMQPIPCGALADIRRHRTSFSHLGDLAPGVSIRMVLCNFLIILVEFFFFFHIVVKSVSSYCVKLEATSREKLLVLWGYFGCLFENGRNSEEDDPASPFVGVVHWGMGALIIGVCSAGPLCYLTYSFSSFAGLPPCLSQLSGLR